MAVSYFVDRTGKSGKIEAKTILELAKKLDLNLEEYIIVKNDSLTVETSKLEDGDKIKFLSVVSGG